MSSMWRILASCAQRREIKRLFSQVGSFVDALAHNVVAIGVLWFSSVWNGTQKLLIKHAVAHVNWSGIRKSGTIVSNTNEKISSIFKPSLDISMLDILVASRITSWYTCGPIEKNHISLRFTMHHRTSYRCWYFRIWGLSAILFRVNVLDFEYSTCFLIFFLTQVSVMQSRFLWDIMKLHIIAPSPSLESAVWTLFKAVRELMKLLEHLL